MKHDESFGKQKTEPSFGTLHETHIMGTQQQFQNCCLHYQFSILPCIPIPEWIEASLESPIVADSSVNTTRLGRFFQGTNTINTDMGTTTASRNAPGDRAKNSTTICSKSTVASHQAFLTTCRVVNVGCSVAPTHHLGTTAHLGAPESGLKTGRRIEEHGEEAVS